jgi:hypothetical protein
MVKRKTTDNNKSKANSNNSIKKKYEQSVFLRHRPNAAIEYNWNNKYYRFEAHEQKKVDASILDNEDFKKAKKYFTIVKGV